MRSWVTLKGAQGASPILSIEYLQVAKTHEHYAETEASQDKCEGSTALLEQVVECYHSSTLLMTFAGEARLASMS